MATHEEIVLEAVAKFPDGASVNQLMKASKLKYQQVRRRLGDLMNEGAVARDGEGGEATYYIGSGARPPPVQETSAEDGQDSGAPRGDGDEDREPLSGDEQKFRRLLKDAGVQRAHSTITENFFSGGQPDDLYHLVDVLDAAKAYITPGQRNLIVDNWSRYQRRDLPEDLKRRLGEADGRRGKDAGDEEPGGESYGLGWRVERDADGVFQPLVGGDYKTHEEASRVAGRLNVSASGVTKKSVGDELGLSVVGGPGEKRPFILELLDRAYAPRGDGDKGLSLADILAIMDHSKPQGDNEEVKALREQVQRLTEAQFTREMAELRQIVTAIANRDPLKDYLELQERLNIIRPQSDTGDSPTVKVIRDGTDKMERSLDRAVGLAERFMIRSHPFKPEEGDEEADERTAGRLADAIEGDTDNLARRKRVYGW